MTKCSFSHRLNVKRSFLPGDFRRMRSSAVLEQDEPLLFTTVSHIFTNSSDMIHKSQQQDFCGMQVWLGKSDGGTYLPGPILAFCCQSISHLLSSSDLTAKAGCFSV